MGQLHPAVALIVGEINSYERNRRREKTPFLIDPPAKIRRSKEKLRGNESSQIKISLQFFSFLSSCSFFDGN